MYFCYQITENVAVLFIIMKFGHPAQIRMKNPISCIYLLTKWQLFAFKFLLGMFWKEEFS